MTELALLPSLPLHLDCSRAWHNGGASWGGGGQVAVGWEQENSLSTLARVTDATTDNNVGISNDIPACTALPSCRAGWLPVRLRRLRH